MLRQAPPTPPNTAKNYYSNYEQKIQLGILPHPSRLSLYDQEIAMFYSRKDFINFATTYRPLGGDNYMNLHYITHYNQLKRSFEAHCKENKLPYNNVVLAKHAAFTLIHTILFYFFDQINQPDNADKPLSKLISDATSYWLVPFFAVITPPPYASPPLPKEEAITLSTTFITILLSLDAPFHENYPYLLSQLFFIFPEDHAYLDKMFKSFQQRYHEMGLYNTEMTNHYLSFLDLYPVPQDDKVYLYHTFNRLMFQNSRHDQGQVYFPVTTIYSTQSQPAAPKSTPQKTNKNPVASMAASTPLSTEPTKQPEKPRRRRHQTSKQPYIPLFQYDNSDSSDDDNASMAAALPKTKTVTVTFKKAADTQQVTPKTKGRNNAKRTPAIGHKSVKTSQITTKFPTQSPPLEPEYTATPMPEDYIIEIEALHKSMNAPLKSKRKSQTKGETPIKKTYTPYQILQDENTDSPYCDDNLQPEDTTSPSPYETINP